MRTLALLVILSGLAFFRADALAQNQPTAVPAAQQAAPPSAAGTAPPVSGTTGSSSFATDTPAPVEENSSYTYEIPTVAKFSQLYWALSKFDLKDDQAVDNYMMINECDIYRDYFHNEFEWQNVREASRNFLKNNKSRFPLRFEIMQPLKFGEYDLKKKRFDVLPLYQIKGIRRFEVYAQDSDTPICGFNNNIDSRGAMVPGYPRGLVVELSRPVLMTAVDVPEEAAKKFIKQKLAVFKTLSLDQQTTNNLYNMRDAFLVMKVKIFSYRKEVAIPDREPAAEVLGILESLEVFADTRKKTLLFSENYNNKKKRVRDVNDRLDLTDTKPMLLEE